MVECQENWYNIFPATFLQLCMRIRSATLTAVGNILLELHNVTLDAMGIFLKQQFKLLKNNTA
jgi:hypothetical protein